MPSDYRRALGAKGELAASEHLERLDHTIICRNFRTRHGELDLVSQHHNTLVFTEVKTRLADRRLTPLQSWQSIDSRKQMRVRSMAREYLVSCQRRGYAADIRFDAIAVVLNATGELVSLEHIEQAF